MTDHEIEMDALAALTEAADRIAAEGPDNSAAVRRFVRGDTVNFARADRGAIEFMAGYMRAAQWLATSPPMAEAEEIVALYKTHMPGSGQEEATVYVDAAKAPNLVAFLREDAQIEIEDGVALKAEFVHDYGDHLKTTFNPPARTFAWPAMTRWYEGFELAVWHAIED